MKTTLAIGLMMICATMALGQTAVEHLRAAKPPVFKQDHTLLPLSRWGWSLPYEATVELCEKWGYALEFGSYATMSAAEAAHDPETRQGKLCALTRSDPDRYPLFVITHRPLGAMEKAGELPESYWLHDAEGNRLEGPKWKRKNPEAPDEIHRRVAEKAVEPLKKIRGICPIAVILHGGESGLSELGHTRPFLKKDPSVVKAKGDRTWWDYYSEQKARWLMPTTRAVREAFPDRRVYIWYHFGGMPRWTAKPWSWDYDHMHNVADMPGQSLYYEHFNSGWTGKSDLLTLFLCSLAQAKTYDHPLSYNWLCAGWKEGEFSDLDRYMGYVKCLYTAGQVGGVAGYFSRPDGGFGGDLGQEIPHWLAQIMILGRAHALFSHLEEFIRDGSLLPGPDIHPVVKQRTGKELPAYEFPTGDPNARVLVRRLGDKKMWILTAWAAAGDAREVTISVDGLGELTLQARPAGSVYRARATAQVKHEPPEIELKLLDKDPMLPSANFQPR
jgi:hypothetical protein